LHRLHLLETASLMSAYSTSVTTTSGERLTNPQVVLKRKLLWMFFDNIIIDLLATGNSSLMFVCHFRQRWI
jgi:hypothetical protein